MRHRKKKPHLARPQDQRKALLRSLATSLFLHGEIRTTHQRAKALRGYADHILTLAKQAQAADQPAQRVHKIRQVARYVFNQSTGQQIASDNGKQMTETIVRRVVRTIAPQLADRKGGYVRVVPMGPRRGDASPMACVQLTDVELPEAVISA